MTISWKCVPCQKVHQRIQNQLMGHLPADRTKPEPPFTVVGVDFAGPLSTTRGNPYTNNSEDLCLPICARCQNKLPGCIS